MASASIWDPCCVPFHTDMAPALLQSFHTNSNAATLSEVTSNTIAKRSEHKGNAAKEYRDDLVSQSIWAELTCRKTPEGSSPGTPTNQVLTSSAAQIGFHVPVQISDRSPAGALACRVAESVVVTPEVSKRRGEQPKMMSLATIETNNPTMEKQPSSQQPSSGSSIPPLTSEMTNFYMQTQRLLAKQMMMYPPPPGEAPKGNNSPTNDQPTSVMNSASGGVEQTGIAFVVLEFKMKRRLRFRCTPGVQIAPGQYAIVQIEAREFSKGGAVCDGIREDAGLCIAVHTWQDTQRATLQKAAMNSALERYPWINGAVVRAATEEDCKIINDELPAVEERALKMCHELVHFLHVPFDCADAECMFDRKVLKIFYTLSPQAETSIVPNVPRLQRELSLRLHLRVFLEQLKTPKQQVSHPRP